MHVKIIEKFAWTQTGEIQRKGIPLKMANQIFQDENFDDTLYGVQPIPILWKSYIDNSFEHTRTRTQSPSFFLEGGGVKGDGERES